MEHCAPWVDQQQPEYWEKLTVDMLSGLESCKVLLKEVLLIYNQSETGYHTVEFRMSCDVLPGSNYIHGQYEIIINGLDYIALNEDLSTWTAVGKAAEILTQQWEKIGHTKTLRPFLEGECVQRLHSHLDYGKEILLRRDTPKLHVTHKIPWKWQKDGSNQNLDMEVIETRPAGDGTFQKWAAVVVPPGEEQSYTCHVNHEGLPEPLTLRWEPPQPSVPIMPIVIGLILGAVLMGAVVTFLIRKWRNKVGKAAEILTQEWDKTVFVKSVTSFLKNKCVTFLLQHLDYGKEFLLRTDIPKFHVTHKVRADGTITLRCWALDFYHSDITLTWQRDGSNQNLDIEVMDTRPARDGTFQKWAAVVVPLGEEQRYTCHVYYEGLPEPLTLRWEPPQLSVPIMPIVTGLVLGVVLMGAVVTFLIWKRRNKGSHSLTYLQTLLTWPDPLASHFIGSAYLDDIHIERLNTITQTPKLEHCAPWLDQQQPEYWEQSTLGMLNLRDFYKRLLKKVLHIYNQSETGYHTVQFRMSCDVLPGVNYIRGQYEMIFNGHDYIALNEDLTTWTAVGKAAEVLSQEFEKKSYAKNLRPLLEGECVQSLLAQLDYGKEILLRKDIPKLHVTHKVRADGNITLRCWAQDFYHAEITLTWQKDGSNQNLDMEVIETRPAGDGTFQKWAAVVVPPGEEQRYTCHVNHEGLPESITLRWEPPQPSVPIMPIVTGLVLGAVLMGAVVTFLIWKWRSKGKKRSGSEFICPWEYQAQLRVCPAS
ncbi:HLA class I histocompatibility antigen, A-24 alpha chain [Cricetulus griseus]|uniref:HLA class I histocompatibility antigen, A-24 alpha chain n=1 Tax=Cricetulus griseus TaxID=10029 RepID=G3HVV6_CRIGR|nr:HLA class I histocompatibility antigen, A-24 alpha chain [Cricetulus griseus]